MSNPHVLVVDDEADIRASIQDILTDEGYGVTVAANAEEARTALAEILLGHGDRSETREPDLVGAVHDVVVKLFAFLLLGHFSPPCR